jgi:hypothetical protein
MWPAPSPRFILGRVNEVQHPAWVLPEAGARNTVCVALKLLDQADRAGPYNRDLGHRLTRQAVELIGPDAVLTIIELQKAGKLPHCVTPEWDRFMEMAAAGDVEIATVILIRDREYICEDRVAERVRQDPPAPPAEPVNLTDDLRAMGLM